MSGNIKSLEDQGEFHARRPAEHQHAEHHGHHQPGTHRGNDAAPEFHATTLPPGTAPKSATYTPHADADNTGIAVDAEDTMTGATSADVYRGLGKPIQGMSSAERHHDGQSHRKHQREGLTGLTETVNADYKEKSERFREEFGEREGNRAGGAKEGGRQEGVGKDWGRGA